MQLNFEKFNFQIKEDNNRKKLIFDIVRKKYVLLAPEEWVRQHAIHHLIKKGWTASRISIERALPQSQKRYDAVFYDQNGKPEMLMECKAPDVNITQKTLDQVVGYIHLQEVPFVLLTNGIQHIFIARVQQELKILTEIPPYSEIKTFFLPPK